MFFVFFFSSMFKPFHFSTVNINGYNVGSIDTILYFLYSVYIIYDIYSKNNKNILNETNRYILSYEDYIKNIIQSDIYKRLSTKCYGNSKNLLEFKKKNWRKTPSVYYPENN